jgi:uncharacterized membrane protein YraQ (UPF0718 family)
MSNSFIGVLLAVGFGGWVYAKTQKSTGGNTQTSLIVAAIAAFFAFVVCLTVLSFIPDGK